MVSPLPQAISISSLSGYESFGAMLKGIRNRYGIKQKQVEEIGQPYFRSRKVPVITFRMYAAMENGVRAPHFDELEPLYLTFADPQGFRIEFSPQERELFVQLAQLRIKEKQKQREELDGKHWEKLAENLAIHDRSKRKKIYLVPKREEAGDVEDEESGNSRRLKAINKAQHTDTSHLLERETWIEQMIHLLKETPSKKLAVVQGYIGTGKSHALALLTQRLAVQSDYYIIPYTFETNDSKTPDEHLDVFLATIYADLLAITTSDEIKQRPLEERLEQIITAIQQREEQGQKVIILLDDVQTIFPSATKWADGWSQFFEVFVREPHGSIIYAMTRIWPGWRERRRSFVVESELPELSTAACVTIWKRFGFRDVEDSLLQQISARCGYNPQMIEMRAYKNTHREFAVTWGKKRDETASRERPNPNTAHIETLLAQDSLFDLSNDISAREFLQQVVAVQMSHQAGKLLECLAVSPLGMPFSLLKEEFPRAEVVFDELVRASLVDLNAAASSRAAVVPLVREAQLQVLISENRREPIDGRVTDIYAYWLMDMQDFRDDAEKASLIAEMVVRYIKQRQSLKAAELFVNFGWLCALFGHMTRIHRVFDEVVRENRGKDEDTKQEVGRLLLRHRIAIAIGQKIERAERDQIYQRIYDMVLADKVTLYPHLELEVLQNMRLLYTRHSQYAEASQMFDNTLERLRLSGQTNPEVHASFLYSNAQFFFGWSEQYQQNSPEALQNMQVAANMLKKSITEWRSCLQNPLPLQEHYFNFKLARSLNDYAFASRILGNLSEAQKAIEESILRKKANGALPHSMAISLSEYSQIMVSQGEILQALHVNWEAVQILERAIQNGDITHRPELGMLLVERANILWQQSRLDEARLLLERAISLIGDKPSRQPDKERAIAQIEEIQCITNSGHPYQLDRRWFARYEQIVSYDDLHMLTQSGPFTEEEQAEFERLASRLDDNAARNRRLELAAQSRKREFALSLQEKRPPIISYPFIPIQNVQERVQSLSTLRKEVASQETHPIVRHIYLDAIDEHMTFLRLIEAVAMRDQDTVWKCNLQLYGKPSEHELKIAMQVLCKTLLNAREHEVAGPVAQEIIAQLKIWGISIHDIIAEELFIPEGEMSPKVDHKLLADEKRQFPTTAVQTFFQDVLNAYGAQNWEVSISPARDHTYVDPNVRKLVLPQKSFTVAKIRQLLAEEIETHTFRALAGQRSSLALLGLGLAGQEATEEGLAKWYVRRVNRQVGAEDQENTWIGTLSSGLASGVLTPMLSFQELRNFLEKYYLLHRLFRSEEGREEALAAAQNSAWTRACRTFRGVPDLTRSGCCSLKDVIYLRGHLEVSRYFEHKGEEQRLYVGAIGIANLRDMEELGILAPNYQNRHLALSPDLADRLIQYSS